MSLAEQGSPLGTHMEKKLYDLWKRVQASQEDYRAVVHICKRLKLDWSWNWPVLHQTTRKAFLGVLTARGGPRKSCVEMGRDEEKAEIFNIFFASVFNSTDRRRAAQSCELEDHNCRSSDFPNLIIDIVSGELYLLKVHRCMGPDGYYNTKGCYNRTPLDRLPKVLGLLRGPHWRVANVIKICKKSTREDPEN